MARYEKLTSQRVMRWAYDLYCKGGVFYAGDRQEDGYPVVAEITLSDDDLARFEPDLDKALTIIMHHKDHVNNPIDDSEARYPIEDIIFDVEYAD
jgi:hypothetical protein